MFCRHKIDLSEEASALPQTLIPRELLGSYAQAGEVLDQANIHATQLLQAAAQQREALLEQASLEVWQRANAQLERWETERQLMCDNLERYATTVANQAITLLLDDTPPPLRLAALIKQLLASEVPAVTATLLCHPLELEATRQCLEHLNNTLWTLRADDTIKLQTLVLNTDEGDFRIDWASMVDQVLKHNSRLSTNYLETYANNLN